MGLRHLLCTLALFIPLSSGAQVTDAPRAVTVKLGAGVEGYTGNLGDAYEIGPLAGVAVALHPVPAVGVELSYSVALHQVATGTDGGLVDGYDVIRQGPQATLTLGPLLASEIRPYVFSGLGLSWTHVRGEDSPVYRDDADVYLPLGGGLSVSSGRLSLDARLGYQVLFGQGSVDAPEGGAAASGGRYQALVSLGLTL